MRIGESFDGFVNVLAIINPDRPFLIRLHRVLRRGAHRRIRVCFPDDCGLVRRISGLISKIVERDDGAFECDLLEILRADFVQRLVRLGDGVFHHHLDRLRRLLPIGDR